MSENINSFFIIIVVVTVLVAVVNQWLNWHSSLYY